MAGKVKAKDPLLTALQEEALAFVRAHPNCRTSDVAAAGSRRIRGTRLTLDSLHRAGLIGQQTSPVYGEYESRWIAEKC